MKSIQYYKYIEDKLFILSRKIESNGKLNILDFHVHSEDFYSQLLNLFFDFSLKNANSIKQNVESIDLIDDINKIVIQVSATSTKGKINSSLSKETIEEYKKNGFSFKFISISKKADDLRKITDYENIYSIDFNPVDDIIDIEYLLKKFIVLGIDKQKEIYEYIKKSLGMIDVDIVKVDSNLSLLINILSKEDLSENCNSSPNLNVFDIERKIEFNNLSDSKQKIDDFKIYHIRISDKYKECDKNGQNKSMSILNKINNLYISNSKIIENTDELYNKIISDVIDIIINSANYEEIPIDELELCVEIFVVDAFIRCKIFKNPNNYNYVTTG